MVKHILGGLLSMAILMGEFTAMHAEDLNKEDIVKIQFVDSRMNPIPFFSRNFEYFAGEKDRVAFLEYVGSFPWDELLTYQEIGAGIAPLRTDKTTFFIDAIYLESKRYSNRIESQRFKNAGFQEKVGQFYVWYFPNGQVHVMSFEEANRLKRDQVNVIEISGDLGSGKWKELGDFLFDAAYHWRVDRGSKKELIKRCDALIEARKKEGDLVWAGNLVFVREHWLHANARIGMFGRKPTEQTVELDQELPWRNAGRQFGRSGAAIFAYPLKPYLALKKVLTVNPKDVRALFWVKVLPWVNGFSPSRGTTGQTADDYIRECKRVYGEYQAKLDDYHRFWFLKEFLQSCDGMTYEARWWMKKKGVKHDTDIQWALDELNALFGKYPFLKYQIVYLKEWLLYMKDPNQIKPLELIDGPTRSGG